MQRNAEIDLNILILFEYYNLYFDGKNYKMWVFPLSEAKEAEKLFFSLKQKEKDGYCKVTILITETEKTNKRRCGDGSRRL